MKGALLYILYCIYDLIDLDQQILTGPIIGKTTETTSRILVEFELPGTITISLTSEDPYEKTHIQTIQLKSRDPTVFHFTDLSPNTKYNISYPYNKYLKTKSGIPSSFKTLSYIDQRKPFSNLNIAIVSCNDIRHSLNYNSHYNLWSDLATRSKRGEIDYILHIGDQVYLDHEIWYGSADNAYAKALNYLNKNNITNFWDHTEEVREIIRDDYRMTFGFQPTAEVLSLVPNIMIMDDHEIHNDLVLDDSFHDPNSFNYFWKNQARYVLYQYQRQLREDVDFENYLNIKNEYFNENLNGIEFIFLDFRGIKAWDDSITKPDSNKGKEEDKYYLGREQDEWVKNILNNNKNNFNTAVIISSIPIAMFSKDFTKYLAKEMKDFEEFWSYRHEKDQIDFLNFLIEWKNKNINHELFLIGGDTHFGIMSDIYYNQTPFIKQLTASAISQMKMPDIYVKAVNTALDMKYSLKKDFCFSHYDYVTDNNYGIARIRNSIKEKAFIEYFLVSSDRKVIRQNKSDYNFSFRDVNIINCCGEDCEADNVNEYLQNMKKYHGSE